jgi:hypothetical protein
MLGGNLVEKVYTFALLCFALLCLRKVLSNQSHAGLASSAGLTFAHFAGTTAKGNPSLAAERERSTGSHH